MTATVHVEREVIVEFSIHGPYRGYRNSMGVPEEPDEPLNIEIESITDEEGNKIDLVPDEEDRLAEELYKNYVDEE